MYKEKQFARSLLALTGATTVMAVQESVQEDPFDALFTLEDEYYQDGFSQGTADGARAGRIEGRLFGYERAFERFIHMGKLHGKAIVLQQRLKNTSPRPGQLPSGSSDNSCVPTTIVDQVPEASVESAESRVHSTPFPATTPNQGHPKDDNYDNGSAQHILPPLPPSQRLAKHIDGLHALTEPLTFSTQNDEDAVADFDDRIRRAGAKAKLLDRLLGDGDDGNPVSSQGQGRVRRAGVGGTTGGDMEEFTLRTGKARTAG